MRSFQDGISKAMDEVVLRALCKDKTKRYQTAAEMAADLRKTITHPRGGFVKYAPEEKTAEKNAPSKKKKLQKEKKRARTMRTAAMLGAAAAALALAAWFCFGVYGRVTVPYVVGQQQSVALDMLDQRGLPAVIDSAYSEEYAAGVVIGVTDALKNMEYTHFFTCGPEPMLKAVYKASVTSGQMSFEKRMGCGFGACMGCSCKTLTGYKRICKEGPVMMKEEILWED